MGSPSPTQKAAVFQRKSSLGLSIFAGCSLCVLLLIIWNDPDALFHMLVAVAFAVSTTLFAPLDRAQVLLQVWDLRRFVLSFYRAILYVWHAVKFDSMLCTCTLHDIPLFRMPLYQSTLESTNGNT
jgi:hypothetical protein